MEWYDYIRGFADGQQDRNSEMSFNPLLSVFRLAGILFVFALTVCYVVLKAAAGLLWLIVLGMIPKRK